jgi:glycosyltransferase involved in cell wall biosynthesis
MRIAITSNAPWTPTGYGVQVAELIKGLKKDDHDVAVMANYGLGGSSINWNGVDIYPQGMDAYSNDLTPYQMSWWLQMDATKKPLGLTLYDVWVYTNPQWNSFPIASWTPIDHKVVPPRVKEWFTNSPVPRWAIAMSKFGQQELLESGVSKDNLFYAPHSFDGNVFRPTKSDMRKKMGVPEGAHLTMINAANKGSSPVRKAWPEVITSWVRWAKGRDDAYLYLHTDVSGAASGVAILPLLESVGANPERVKIVPQFEYKMGIHQNVLAATYSTADVLLLASRGEGFGVPLIEAQACGTPVITTNWTAMPELCGSGWLVEGQEEYDHLQGGWWKVPSIDSIMEALEASYDLKKNPDHFKKARKQAVTFAKDYESTAVYNRYWRPLLKEIDKRILFKEE